MNWFKKYMRKEELKSYEQKVNEGRFPLILIFLAFSIIALLTANITLYFGVYFLYLYIDFQANKIKDLIDKRLN